MTGQISVVKKKILGKPQVKLMSELKIHLKTIYLYFLRGFL